MTDRLAVVLFNLGGPDGPEALRPFLFNLFNDKAIIGAPQPIRWLLARFISTRRAPVAQQIYAELGGGSPLLANTETQAEALAAMLVDRNIAEEVRCFIAMRYWHPLTEETVTAVRDWAPDRVVMLPLYPQYSTTTTGSSVGRWTRCAESARLMAPTAGICCYPVLDGFIEAVAGGVREALGEISSGLRPRVLFTAHGLPEKIIAAGDPYQGQVERTAAAVAARVGGDGYDWTVCYQSRVGPLQWIGPATDDVIREAGVDGRPVVVVPIAFVSEHSETLVELDIEYRALAREAGVPQYVRVATVGTSPAFIAGLADLVAANAAAPSTGAAALCSAEGGRVCPADRSGCGFAAPG
ncbi:MAG: ferrochelatase [Alphaproteobacteria bacterium]|nr:ferrochelatase [Alphaproteobacteria bacterium]